MPRAECAGQSSQRPIPQAHWSWVMRLHTVPVRNPKIIQKLSISSSTKYYCMCNERLEGDDISFYSWLESALTAMNKSTSHYRQKKKNQSNCITVQKVTEVQERSSSWFVFLLEVILNWESWSEIGTIYWKQGKKTNRNSNILIIKNVQREGDSHAKTWYDGKKMMDRPFAHHAFLRL